jgi:hypothetical protein
MACRSEGAADVANACPEIVASINTEAAKAKFFIMVLFPCLLPITRHIGEWKTPGAVMLIWACYSLALLNSASEAASLRTVLCPALTAVVVKNDLLVSIEPVAYLS